MARSTSLVHSSDWFGTFEEDERSSGRKDKFGKDCPAVIVPVPAVSSMLDNDDVTAATEDVVGFVGTGLPEYFFNPNLIFLADMFFNKQFHLL